jgi:class 3 adenylate cyclase
LDPESLSKAINVYFHQIVDLVTSQGGDILKFAGDAVFAEWKTMSDESKHDENQVTMDHCVCAAATCAASIVAQCSDFPVSSQGIGTGAQVATLNVHCGLGVGEIVGLHLGDHETRREFIVLGDPIDQVTEAEGAADLGEVAASPKFLAAMAKSCRMEGGVASVSHHVDRPVVIARRGIAFFTVNRNHCLALESRVDKWACRGVLRYTKNWNGDVLERYRKLLSLYAHPVVVANESAAVKNPQLKSTAEERQREEAELRSVYVMFITPLISVRVTGNNEIDCANFQRLNNILNVTTRELSRFSGHLRQFIVDDKGKRVKCILLTDRIRRLTV